MNTWNGEFYQDHAVAQVTRANAVLDQIQFVGDEYILDIGCGDGGITRAIAQRVSEGKVIGIDLSKEMIAQAKASHSEVRNLSFERQCAEDIHFDCQFDYIFSFNALHWVRDLDRAFSRVKSVLKPGGKIYFLLASGERNPYVDQVLSRPPFRSKFKLLDEFHNRMNQLDCAELLTKHGFIVEYNETDEHRYTFSNLEEMENSLLTWLPAVSTATLADCQEAAKEIALAAHKDAKASDSPYTLSFSMLHLEARLPNISS